MGLWNLGSVAGAVLSLVENVPSNISGTRLLEIADQKRQYCENITGITIGSNSIDINFQDPIVKLTASNVLSYMQLVGADASSIKLGDFTINKGRDSNLKIVSESLSEMAHEELKALGYNIGFTEVCGW